jgi:hypothetical protein
MMSISCFMKVLCVYALVKRIHNSFYHMVIGDLNPCAMGLLTRF